MRKAATRATAVAPSAVTKTPAGRREKREAEELRFKLKDAASALAILGNRVRKARARRGMSRKQLTRNSGVSERYLAQIESGRGNISVLVLRQLAKALSVPLDTLLYEGAEPSV